MELLEFDIQYQPKGAIKSQCLADFLVELTPQHDLQTEWIVYADRSSNETVCGVGVVLEGLGDLILEQALKFEFKAPKNQAECEFILVGLSLAYDMGVRKVTCKSDSQLVVGQINGEPPPFFRPGLPTTSWCRRSRVFNNNQE